MAASPVKVLVVDDYEPFRRFVFSMLGERPELQIIGEASDGLEAVQKAEELRPDLILLDVGLPILNGIEAARQIRSIVQESKIIFVSQETSADVVQEAFRVGALGYLAKTDAGSELLTALSAVLGVRHSLVADSRSTILQNPQFIPGENDFILTSPDAGVTLSTKTTAPFTGEPC